MKLSNLFNGLLCASSALAFKKPTLPRHIVERSLPNQEFSHPEIQKRASQFLTEKTKG
jgi:carboxypeptidase D